MLDRDKIVQILASGTKELNEYKEYVAARKAVEEIPELLERVNEYRMKNYTFQRSHGNVNSEVIEDLARLREELVREKAAREYLRAELAFCRSMQDIVTGVVKELDFELGFDLYQ